MLHSIITAIQKPTASVLGLVEKLREVGIIHPETFDQGFNRDASLR
jgi:hypothetical protein